MKHWASGPMWGEGPRFHDGALWLSDTQGSRLWTNASGTWTPHALASPSNGLWFQPNGSLLAVMMAEARVGRWTGTEFAPYADLSGVARGRLGDCVGDSDGNLYVGDLGPVDGSDLAGAREGQIILVGTDGRARVVATDVAFPNGMALLDDGATLVVAETFEQRLLAFAVASDGSLGGRRLFADVKSLVSASATPDGIWATGDAVWVATLDAQAVVRIGPDGVSANLPTPGPVIACCTDDDGRLFVTVADTGGRPVFEALAARAVSADVWITEDTA